MRLSRRSWITRQFRSARYRPQTTSCKFYYTHGLMYNLGVLGQCSMLLVASTLCGRSSSPLLSGVGVVSRLARSIQRSRAPHNTPIPPSRRHSRLECNQHEKKKEKKHRKDKKEKDGSRGLFAGSGTSSSSECSSSSDEERWVEQGVNGYVCFCSCSQEAWLCFPIPSPRSMVM